MKYFTGEAWEKAERDAIEKAKMGSSVFHMGSENEISIVGHKFKRNSTTILGNKINENGKILGKV